MNSQHSNRICNVLTLLQCIASDESVRDSFIACTFLTNIISAQFPLYLYPFLNTTCKTKPYEFLRLTSLGVIGALVKNENSEIVSYLLGTEIVPLCLRIMEVGNELSKTVSIFVIQKIILDNYGLSYICQSEPRLNAVLDHFETVFRAPVDSGKASRMLKHAIRCYLRLTEDERGINVLRRRCPSELLHESIIERTKDDPTTIKFVHEIRDRIK